MLERWVPIGECCLRKLDSIILLYEALNRFRSIREHRIPDTIDEQLEIVKEPVDLFNQAVDKFDAAVGMDLTYKRYGQAGAGYYKVGMFDS